MGDKIDDVADRSVKKLNQINPKAPKGNRQTGSKRETTKTKQPQKSTKQEKSIISSTEDVASVEQILEELKLGDNFAIHQKEWKNGKAIKTLIKHVKTQGLKGITEEWKTLKVEPGPHSAFSQNDAKNRYFDVLCLDHARVKLLDGDRDYIHANYVDGYRHRKAYICCQGPLAETAGDFWHMIWQEENLVIAMLTKVVENGKIKCAQYWPPTEMVHKDYGNFSVFTEKIEHRRSYDQTKLVLRNNITKERRRVMHFLYIAWPDFGVPKNPAVFLDFIRVVRHTQSSMVKKHTRWEKIMPLGPPIVVHCSAGVGRTGTFIAVDIAIRRFIDTAKTDLCDIVQKIRTQRFMAVQKPEQYMFAYLSVIHFALSLGVLTDEDNQMVDQELEKMSRI